MRELLWIGATFALILQSIVCSPLYQTSENDISIRTLLPAALLVERNDGVNSRATKLGGGVDLVVMPIGEYEQLSPIDITIADNCSSITWGIPSSDSNGYRNILRGYLTSGGNAADFVGSIVSGTMVDNQHEGHRGYEIDQIASSSTLGISASPNLVLLHAATNDMARNVDVANAPTRLRNLIDTIFKNNPTAALFVCQIVPANNANIQARISAYNAQIPGIVKSYVDAGKKVTLVNMGILTVGDLADELHPTDAGYRKMADIYYDAILSANSKGWIVAAGPPVPASPEFCVSLISIPTAGSNSTPRVLFPPLLHCFSSVLPKIVKSMSLTSK